MQTVVNPGWVLSVLTERGFLVPERDVLRQALNGVDDSRRQEVQEALSVLARGGEDEAKMELAGTLGRALSGRIRSTLADLGLPYDPSAVLQWAMTSPDWQTQLQQAERGDGQAMESLRHCLRPADSGGTRGRPDSGDQKGPDLSAAAWAAQQEERQTAAQEHSQRASSAEPPSDVELHPRRTHHVYGAKAALAIEMDVARAREGADRPFTLRIEGAKASGDGRANGSAIRYDWERKLVFQLTHRELHQAAAVLIGASPGCEFSAHGDNRDKRCEIAAQPGGIFVKLSQGKHTVAVPIGADDLFDVALLAVRALSQNDPDLDQGVLLDILRLTTKATSRA